MSSAVHVAKSLLAVILVHTGFLALLQRLRRPHVLVLAYHRVTLDADMDKVDYPAMHVSTRSFAAQLRALRRLYDIVPLGDLAGILAGTTPLRRHVAAVTFDDGYRDNFRHAFPILAQENIPATFFLSLGFVDGREPFWFDRLAAAAHAWDAKPEARDAARADLPAALVGALQADAPRVERLRRAAAFLKTLPDVERATIVERLAQLDATVDRSSEPMQWDEVRALRAAGMGIGAHGTQHAILTRMDPAASSRDIATSVEQIGSRLGMQVEAFAYPNGDADTQVAAQAAGAGVQLAFTMQPENPRPGADRFRIGRRNVCEDTSRSAWKHFSRAYFCCEITGVFDLVLRRGARSN